MHGTEDDEEELRRRAAAAYEHQPRRRRTDDLTLNEWRLLELEQRLDRLEERTRNSMREVYGRIDALKTWIVGTAIAICAVVLTATGLSVMLRR